MCFHNKSPEHNLTFPFQLARPPTLLVVLEYRSKMHSIRLWYTQPEAEEEPKRCSKEAVGVSTFSNPDVVDVDSPYSGKAVCVIKHDGELPQAGTVPNQFELT